MNDRDQFGRLRRPYSKVFGSVVLPDSEVLRQMQDKLCEVQQTNSNLQATQLGVVESQSQLNQHLQLVHEELLRFPQLIKHVIHDYSNIQTSRSEQVQQQLQQFDLRLSNTVNSINKRFDDFSVALHQQQSSLDSRQAELFKSIDGVRVSQQDQADRVRNLDSNVASLQSSHKNLLQDNQLTLASINAISIHMQQLMSSLTTAIESFSTEIQHSINTNSTGLLDNQNKSAEAHSKLTLDIVDEIRYLEARLKGGINLTKDAIEDTRKEVEALKSELEIDEILKREMTLALEPLGAQVKTLQSTIEPFGNIRELLVANSQKKDEDRQRKNSVYHNIQSHLDSQQTQLERISSTIDEVSRAVVQEDSTELAVEIEPAAAVVSLPTRKPVSKRITQSPLFFWRLVLKGLDKGLNGKGRIGSSIRRKLTRLTARLKGTPTVGEVDRQAHLAV